MKRIMSALYFSQQTVPDYERSERIVELTKILGCTTDDLPGLKKLNGKKDSASKNWRLSPAVTEHR